jgi:hypothetical protein
MAFSAVAPAAMPSSTSNTVTVQPGHGVIASISTLAPPQLGELERGFSLQFLLRDTEIRDDIVMENDDAAHGDRAHRQFRLKRNTQLAHDADVERQIQGLRNLETHHHAATGDRRRCSPHDLDTWRVNLPGNGLHPGDPPICVASCLF